MLNVHVVVRDADQKTVADYVMDHDNKEQRRALGEQCRNAFEAGQSVHTWPVQKDDK
jgi:hypothetical protein